jgi:hypothetical protein
MKERGIIHPEDVHLRFVGRFGDDVHAMLDASSFSSSIERIAYVTHQESVGFLMRSEASLLIVDDAKESAEIVPGKVYEYLGVGRPVIAVAPRGSAIERLLLETKAGQSASQDDIEGIASIVEAYFSRWKRGEQILSPNTAEILKYERRTAAHQLAHILHTLTP